MAIIGIQSLVYGVADVEKSRRFFEDFGLPLERASESQVRFALPEGSSVTLRQQDDPELPTSSMRGPGVRQVIWGVDDQVALDRLASDLARDCNVRSDQNGTVHFLTDFGLAMGLRVFQKQRVVCAPEPSNAPGHTVRLNQHRRWRQRAHPKGIAHVDELRALAHEDARLPPAAKAALSQIGGHLDEIGAAIKAIEDEIAKEHAQNQMSQLIDEIPAFGPLIASAIAASVPDPKVFRSGRDFAAWLGATPRQDSTGGKTTLGPITKKGNPYLRKMLVVGARSVLHVAHKRKGALAEWIMKMRANKKERVAVVALANKLARICWAVMSSGECFRSEIYARA